MRILIALIALVGFCLSCDGGGGGAATDTGGGVDAAPQPADTAGEVAGADTGGEDLGTPDAGPGYEIPAPTELAGWVRVIEQVDLDGSLQYAMIDAMLWATPLPTTQERVDQAGDCVVLDGERMVGWLCDPECAWGEAACIDGECVDYPAPAPTGKISLSGLTEPINLSPTAMGHYTVGGLPEDLFIPGAVVSMTSEGGDTPALDLSAMGVENLVVDLATSHFEPGEDAVFHWTAGTDPAARIQFLLQTGWHGATSTTTIWCETADDGELVIPASLTAQFDIPGCGECEGSFIRRFTRDWVDAPGGPVELFVASQIWFVPWWE